MIGVDRQHIPRGMKNSPDDCLAQGDFRCHISVKKFSRHISLVIEVSDIGCRQTQHGSLGITLQQPLHSHTPHFCTAAVKFI